MSASVSDRVLIDTGLRLDVGSERFAVVRCSQNGAGGYLRPAEEIPSDGPDRFTECPECDGAQHRVVDIDDGIEEALTAPLEDEGIALSLANIVSVSLGSLRRQVAQSIPHRSRSRR